MKVVSCLKCNYSRREKTENANAQTNGEPLQENNANINEEINILNNLDRQNEN